MTTNTIQELLALIEKPSRYLGSEINAVKKDLHGVKLRFALAFPDLYEIGTSHFGLQILYHILNRRPEIAAERVFAPATDLEERLRQSRTPLFSLESHTPLNRFDIIGFSLLYELNYTRTFSPSSSFPGSRRSPAIAIRLIPWSLPAARAPATLSRWRIFSTQSWWATAKGWSSSYPALGSNGRKADRATAHCF